MRKADALKQTPAEETIHLADGPMDVTMEHYRQVMQQKAQERVQACLDQINRVLAQHGCALSAEPVLTPDGRLLARPLVALKPEE
jgi:adenosylmethionine-8-amino-7-oxononanoate aminotransferase